MVLCKPQKSSENPKIKLSDERLFVLENWTINWVLAYPLLKFEQEFLRTNYIEVPDVNKAVCNILEYKYIQCFFYVLSTFNQRK
jgi:hypothetical protein